MPIPFLVALECHLIVSSALSSHLLREQWWDVSHLSLALHFGKIEDFNILSFLSIMICVSSKCRTSSPDQCYQPGGNPPILWVFTLHSFSTQFIKAKRSTRHFYLQNSLKFFVWQIKSNVIYNLVMYIWYISLNVWFQIISDLLWCYKLVIFKRYCHWAMASYTELTCLIFDHALLPLPSTFFALLSFPVSLVFPCSLNN